MSYTVTKTTSWFERLGKSFSGIIVGMVLFVGATVLLWWNEGNFVKTQVALKEAQTVTQELENISKVDSSLNGQLVHATGRAETEDILDDPVFGISINAIRLERTVEYFQWVEDKRTETRQKLGGGEEKVTTYFYSQKWVHSPVDSLQFAAPGASGQYKNFVFIKLDDFTVQATNVTFGAYRLPKFLIDLIRIPESFSVELSDDVMTKLNEQLAPWLPSSSLPAPTSTPLLPLDLQDNTDAVGGATAIQNQWVHVNDNTIYIGLSPSSPQTADTRITFKRTLPATVSLIAKLNGDTLESYVAKNGRTVGLLSVGTHSAENMYESAHTANALLTWILRLLGIILVCIGLSLITAPLSVLASVVPFLGKLVGAGTGIVCVLLGLAWSLLVIAVAWLFYRPLVAIVLLVAVVVLIALLYRRGQSTIR